MSEHKSSVSERLLALKVLFTDWSLRGVPHGVAHPTSVASLLKWTSPDHGIYLPLGSKRDVNMTNSKYKDEVIEINKLLGTLTPEAPGKKKRADKKPRVYKTQKARRVTAEDKAKRLETLLDEVTKQWTAKDIELEKALLSLKYERQERKDLQRALDEAREDNAKLTRRLEKQLRVVD